MRIAVLIVLGVISEAAYAEPPACPYLVTPMYAHVLTPEQRRAAFAGKRTGDPVVDEAAFRIKGVMKPSADPPRKQTRVSWEQARSLILLGLVHSVVEYRDGPVVLVALSGAAYSTRPTSVDALNTALNSVDPCFLFISREFVG